MNRPEIVVLCGSTRFYDEFQRANYELTMQGKIVLSVGFYPHASEEHGHGEGVGHDSDEKIKLDELHKRKIDLADRVFVLNVGGYVGDSTRSEIAYASEHGKPITWLEPRVKLGPERKERSVIDEAHEIIHGARQLQYGGPAASFRRIAELWSAYLRGVNLKDGFLTGHDVAMMMILLKVSRAKNGIDTAGSPQRDSLVDIIGYAGCSELIGL